MNIPRLSFWLSIWRQRQCGLKQCLKSQPTSPVAMKKSISYWLSWRSFRRQKFRKLWENELDSGEELEGWKVGRLKVGRLKVGRLEGLVQLANLLKC